MKGWKPAMKTLIIYWSKYNKNTEKIAQLFADYMDCDLIDINNANDINIENYNLIGIGSGVYKESLSPKMYRLVDELNFKGKNIFVFSTSGVGMKFYNKPLVKLLESKGAINKGSFACKGSFIAKDFTDKKIFDLMGKLSQGHPNDRELKKAEKFIERLSYMV